MSNPLPRNSDATFVMAFEREGAGTFWEGHVRAFEFFGGGPYEYPPRPEAWRLTLGGSTLREPVGQQLILL